MRINRSKSSRKTLRLYKILFGLESPYNVIVAIVIVVNRSIMFLLCR